VTGNLGDSFVGLKILQNKFKVSKKLRSYFVKKYFEPNIQIKLTNELLKFANSSIDISDGLVDDLEKMINNQKLSYEIWQEKVPISKYLQSYLRRIIIKNQILYLMVMIIRFYLLLVLIKLESLKTYQRN
jgi:thiamine-monophosphate kinase